MKQKITSLKPLIITLTLLLSCSFLNAQTPVFHFNFDGNLNDQSSNATSLTPQGTFSPVYVDDRNSNANSALDFPGVNGDFLASNFNGITGTSARSISAWVKTNFTSSGRLTIVSWGTNASEKMFNVMIEKGAIRLEAGSSNVKTAENLLNDDKWHHLAVTFTEADTLLNQCKIYIDGTEVAIATNFNGIRVINTDATTVRIGQAIYGTSHFFRSGALDDIRIYDTALTSSEVLTVAGISASAKPIADFTLSSTSPSADDIITLTDASKNEPTTYLWDFGSSDAIGDITAKSPLVSYSTAGTYTVSLTVSNTGGSDTVTKTDVITVSANSGSGVLQAQYNFNGDVNDSSTYARNLVATGSFTVTYENDNNANASSALTNSGVSEDHLISGYGGVSGTNERTIAAWFKTTGNSREPIISYGTNSSGKMFNVMIDGSTDAGGLGLTGVPRIEGGASSLKTIDSGLNDGNWHHIAVTYNPIDGDKLSDCKIYVDGVLSTNSGDNATSTNAGSGLSFNATSTVINTKPANFLKIGAAIYSSFAFDGALDDVRIYDKALTAAEITAVKNNTTLSLENNITSNEFLYYPNPAKDIITIKSTFSFDSKIELYSILGSKIKPAIIQKNNNLLQLDVNKLATGIYTLVIINDKNSESFKFIKK